MIRFRTLLPLLLVLCATALAGCASTRNAPPEEWDGLVRQPGTRLGAVFVRPDAEIVGYRSVMIDPVEVSFARNWDPNRGGRSQLGRLDAGDMAAIQAGVAELFRETFRAELERGGYPARRHGGSGHVAGLGRDRRPLHQLRRTRCRLAARARTRQTQDA